MGDTLELDIETTSSSVVNLCSKRTLVFCNDAEASVMQLYFGGIIFRSSTDVHKMLDYVKNDPTAIAICTESLPLIGWRMQEPVQLMFSKSFPVNAGIKAQILSRINLLIPMT